VKGWEQKQLEREVKINLPPSTLSWLMDQDTHTVLYYFRLLFASFRLSDEVKAEAAKILWRIMAKNPNVSADDYVLFSTVVEMAPFLGVK
jgi:hypothetical protein